MDEHTRHHVHESPSSMTVPLMVLAAGSIVGGWIGIPRLIAEGGFFQAFEHWLAPVFEHGHAAEVHEGAHASHSTELMLMLLSVAVAIGGILVARHVYLKLKESQRPSGGALYPILLNKWYVDELYNRLFVNGLSKGGGSFLARFDQKVLDGGVNGVGWITRLTSSISILWDQYVVDGLVNLAAFSVKVLSYPMRFVQSGFVQSYALMVVVGLFVILGYYWTH